MERRGEVDTESDLPDMPAAPAPRRKWALTQDAFDKLLAAFGEDRESAAEKYLQVRGNLIRFFEWRGCPFPEDHADETINRVARKLAEGEEIRNPAGYCSGVARMLLLEINKERAREQQAMGELANSPPADFDASESERQIECLRACLENLSADNRELIVEYYQGEKGTKIENRKRLTERFRVPVNTLRMRALRLREKLQACVEECVRSV
jgi:DNA-directed RNA polymerase specialized sigma24 family protein